MREGEVGRENAATEIVSHVVRLGPDANDVDAGAKCEELAREQLQHS